MVRIPIDMECGEMHTSHWIDKPFADSQLSCDEREFGIHVTRGDKATNELVVSLAINTSAITNDSGKWFGVTACLKVYDITRSL